MGVAIQGQCTICNRTSLIYYYDQLLEIRLCKPYCDKLDEQTKKSIELLKDVFGDYDKNDNSIYK